MSPNPSPPEAADSGMEDWQPMEEDYLSMRNSYQVDTDDAGVAITGYSKSYFFQYKGIDINITKGIDINITSDVNQTLYRNIDSHYFWVLTKVLNPCLSAV